MQHGDVGSVRLRRGEVGVPGHAHVVRCSDGLDSRVPGRDFENPFPGAIGRATSLTMTRTRRWIDRESTSTGFNDVDVVVRQQADDDLFTRVVTSLGLRQSDLPRVLPFSVRTCLWSHCAHASGRRAALRPRPSRHARSVARVVARSDAREIGEGPPDLNAARSAVSSSAWPFPPAVSFLRLPPLMISTERKSSSTTESPPACASIRSFPRAGSPLAV